MTFKIIKNAKIPNERRGSGSVYPFADLEVGDGFDAPDDMGKTNFGGSARQNSMISSARSFAKKHSPNAKFTVRRLNQATFRCARVA